MMRDTDDDPILWAGAARCVQCGRAALPTDAEWLDDGWLILAAYSRPCGHVGERFNVIDLRAYGAGPGKWPALPGDLALYLPGRRCLARNKRGRPCRAFALPGSDCCGAHPPTGNPP